MKSDAKALAVAAAIVFAGGCQSASQRTPVPALLSSTNAATTAELSAAASKLLGGRPVTLGRSAFVETNSLTLEVAMRHSPLGRLGTGRLMVEPDALRLLRVGRRCRLEHINSGKQTELALTNCIADPTAANN